MLSDTEILIGEQQAEIHYLRGVIMSLKTMVVAENEEQADFLQEVDRI